MSVCGQDRGFGQGQGRGTILGPSSLFKYLYKILIRYLRVLCFKGWKRKLCSKTLLLLYSLKEYKLAIYCFDQKSTTGY